MILITRLESIDAGDGSVSLKILGQVELSFKQLFFTKKQVDEVVGMTWVWTDGEKSESKVTTCTVGQVSFSRINDRVNDHFDEQK